MTWKPVPFAAIWLKLEPFVTDLLSVSPFCNQG